jgi:hypothetical protein
LREWSDREEVKQLGKTQGGLQKVTSKTFTKRTVLKGGSGQTASDVPEWPSADEASGESVLVRALSRVYRKLGPNAELMRIIWGLGRGGGTCGRLVVMKQNKAGQSLKSKAKQKDF